VKRVVLTGSESTGKTELARRLGAHYGVEFVAEFVRTFAEAKGGPLEFSDHDAIARGQMALEDAALARGESLVVQDTDLLSTALYCDHYYHRVPEWIVEEVRRRRPDLYLLMDIDVPWIPDPARDRGDRREEMHELFERAVRKSGARYELVRGSWEERYRQAVRAIDELLSGA
jgi:NadR type nicotinamide-nucleotide adenylyltransferase